MKNSVLKFFLIVIFLIFELGAGSAIKIYAQPSLNLFTGYGMSSFKNVAHQANYLPVGAQLMFGIPVFNFGIEANYAAIPFIFNVFEGEAGKNVKEIKFQQLFVGSVVKINLTEGNFIPFCRLGGGLYSGKEIIKWTEEEKKRAAEQGINLQDYKVPLKNTIGFNAGGGFDLILSRYSGLFFEYVFHLVSRKENIKDGSTFKADNWVVQAGYKFNFL